MVDCNSPSSANGTGRSGHRRASPPARLLERPWRFCALAALSASLIASPTVASPPPRHETTAQDSDAAISARADTLIAQMTPEEKAAQITQYFYLQPVPAANEQSLAALATTGVGSLLFVTDPVEINRLQRMAV